MTIKEELYRSSVDKMIENIRKSKEFEIDTSEYKDFDLYQVPLKLFKNLVLICDGKKKEWIAPSLFSKCLALELLSVIFSRNGWVLKYLKDFTNVIKDDFFKILMKNFETTNDFILGKNKNCFID